MWDWRQENFLPCLFFRNTKSLSPIVGDLSTMTIEKYRLRIMNPVTPEKEKYLIFHQARTELIRDVTVGGGFSNASHLLALREERHERAKNRDEANNSKLLGLVGAS